MLSECKILKPVLFFSAALKNFEFGIMAAYFEGEVIQFGFDTIKPFIMLIKPFVMFLKLFICLFVTVKKGIKLLTMLIFNSCDVAFNIVKPCIGFLPEFSHIVFKACKLIVHLGQKLKGFIFQRYRLLVHGDNYIIAE